MSPAIATAETSFKSHPKLTKEQLKALPGLVTHSLSQEESYPFSLLLKGLPKSGLVEISGAWGMGKTEAVLHFLKENPSLRVAWIEKEFSIFPSAFSSYQVELERVLFIDLSSPSTQQSPLWCATQILKSQLFQTVILSHFVFQEIELRRLQLLAKQAGSLIILLRTFPSKERTWPLSLQVQVKRYAVSEAPVLTILKEKRSAFQ